MKTITYINVEETAQLFKKLGQVDGAEVVKIGPRLEIKLGETHIENRGEIAGTALKEVMEKMYHNPGRQTIGPGVVHCLDAANGSVIDSQVYFDRTKESPGTKLRSFAGATLPMLIVEGYRIGEGSGLRIYYTDPKEAKTLLKLTSFQHHRIEILNAVQRRIVDTEEYEVYPVRYVMDARLKSLGADEIPKHGEARLTANFDVRDLSVYVDDEKVFGTSGA